MKQITILLSIFIISLSSIFYSCRKEIKGCKDPDSTNYNANATVDDGSCQFTGKIVFWYDYNTADWLVNTNSSTSLTYKVDGTIVGSSAASVYFTSAPSCGESGAITVEKSLGNSKTKSFSYSVTDDNGMVVWSGNIDFKANTCIKFNLHN